MPRLRALLVEGVAHALQFRRNWVFGCEKCISRYEMLDTAATYLRLPDGPERCAPDGLQHQLSVQVIAELRREL